jgi:hypothetical protein
MAFDEKTAHRIRQFFETKGIEFSERKMFSGVCFMVDDKMCCGTHIDKKTDENLLLCRISEDEYKNAIERNDCLPMNFTGKEMKGFIFVTEEGFQNDNRLADWLQLCLDFNPSAKRSKK